MYLLQRWPVETKKEKVTSSRKKVAAIRGKLLSSAYVLCSQQLFLAPPYHNWCPKQRFHTWALAANIPTSGRFWRHCLRFWSLHQQQFLIESKIWKIKEQRSTSFRGRKDLPIISYSCSGGGGPISTSSPIMVCEVSLLAIAFFSKILDISFKKYSPWYESKLFTK